MIKRVALAVAILAVSAIGVRAQSQPASSFIAVSPNTNALRGIDDPATGDKLLQRQNEPAIAVSTRNPNHIMIAANDYRTVDIADDVGVGNTLTRVAYNVKHAIERVLGALIGRRELEVEDETIEKIEASSGEAWIGLYLSNDAGRSYSSFFMPGFPADPTTAGQATPAFGRQAASDPVLVAAPAGRFYLGAMVFDRSPITKKPTFSQIVVSQFTDRNNSETGQNFHFDQMTVVDDGKINGREFLDKPAIVADVNRKSSDPAACGPVYIGWTVFDERETDPMERSKILVARSTDCGVKFNAGVKINARSFLSQGVALAIRPSDGAVFAAYRSFSENKMYVTYSDTDGATFKPPQVVSGPLPLLAFDQPSLDAGDGYSFRTNGFPTIAIDGTDTVYTAWQERLVPNGNPRIVITKSTNGKVWTPKQPVEATRCVVTPSGGTACGEAGPQVMPSLSFSRGRLMLVFYEARPGVDNVKRVASRNAWYITGLDVQIAVRVAQLDANGIGPSTLVSHYATDANGEVPLITSDGGTEYRHVNRPNLPMYAAGTVPFMGDYLALAPTMPFVPADVPAPAASAATLAAAAKPPNPKNTPFWRWATEDTDGPTPTFVTAWADNRDVVFPRDPATNTLKINGPWATYGAPGFGPCINPGARNANVYAAFVSPRLIAGTPTSFKDLSIQRAFPLFVQNQTSDHKFYRLSIVDTPPAVEASFRQIGADLNTRDIEVFPRSTVTTNVFAKGQSGATTQTFRVDIAELTAVGGALVPGGDAATVLFNGDQSNPALPATNTTNEIHAPRIFNPKEPSKSTPQIDNPQIDNPQIDNPQIDNLSVLNPQIDNPQIDNSLIPNLQLSNVAPTDGSKAVVTNVTNYTWQVANVGNTASSFAPIFHIANQAALQGKHVRLFIYKTYRTPTFSTNANGECVVNEAPRDQVISVIDNPQIDNPQIDNPQIDNPQIDNPQIDNATFFVAPSDAAAASARSVARRSGGATLAAVQAAAAPPDDFAMPVIDAPTMITLQITAGTTPNIAPPPTNPDGTPLPVDPPLPPTEFTSGGAMLAVTATSNDVVDGVVQAIPQAVTTGPDLVVSTPPTASVPANATVPANTVVTFSSFTVENTGEQATSGPFKYGFYLSPTEQIDPHTAVELGSAIYPSPIAPGSPVTLAGGSFTIPAGTGPGPYFIGVRLNSGDPTANPAEPVLFEPENNDSFTIPITVVPGANLVVLERSLTPSTLIAGQTTTASVTVANSGTVPAAGTTTTFFLSTDAVLSANDTLLGSVTTPPLAAGASATVQAPLVIPAVGATTYTVIIQADTTNTVPESTKTDNTGTTSLTVIANNSTSTLSVQQQPTPVLQGHAIAPAVQVKVVGGNNAPRVGALVQMTLVPVAGSGTLTGTTSATTDAAGIATFSNLKVTLPGTYTLSASAPTLGSSNTVTSAQFTVTPNQTPTATGESFSVSQSGTLNVTAPGVLGNDTDADGDPLTAVLITDVAHGQLTLNANGSFTYTPTASFAGPDAFVYQASDGVAPSASVTVSLTVVATTNQAPVFTKGADQSVFEDAGPQAVPGWATGIGPGSPNESGQTLNFIVANNNTALFSAQPAIAANGTLLYTAAANANGSATVTVQLHDNGGTANGGADTSAPQTFTIAVTAVNDPPNFTTGPDLTVTEDAGARAAPNWATNFSPGPADESGQTPLAYHIVSNSNPALFAGAPAIGGAGVTLFGTDGNGRRLLTINPATGISAVVGTMTLAASAPSLAVDPATGTMFLGTGSGTPSLYTVNPTTAAATLVGNTGLGAAAIGGLAFSPTGVLYGSVNTVGDGGTGGDHLAIINTATGIATIVGAYGSCGATSCTIEGIEGIAFDSAGTLWATHTAHSPNGAAGLYTINTTTGAATFVAPYAQAGGGPAPAGGIASLVFASDGTLFGGTARSSGGSNGGFLVTIDKTNGLFSYVGVASATPTGTSLAALAFASTANTLTFTPIANANGSATIGVTVQDNGGTANGGVDTSAIHTFTITVTNANDPPVATPQSATTLEDTNAPIVLAATDIDNDPLTFSIVTAPTHGILTGSPPNVTYTPAADYNGADSFSFKATDGVGTGAIAGLVSRWPFDGNTTDVVDGNSPSASGGVSFVAGQLNQGLSLAAGGFIDVPDAPNLRLQTFTLSAWVEPQGPNTTADAFGDNIIAKWTLNGGGAGSVSLGWRASDGRFVFVVNNSVPTLTSTSGFPAGTFHHVAATYDGATARLFVDGVSQGSVALTTSIVYDTQKWGIGTSAFRGVGFDRTWKGVLDDVRIYSRALTASEVLTLATNGGASNTALVSITVAAVNDPPSFTKGANQTAANTAGAQSVPNWATNMSVGPPNESGQTLNFLVSNNNNGLFSAQPAVAPNGTLTYTPAANTTGAATVSVQLHDNGGTANGGVDTNAAQTFTISVTGAVSTSADLSITKTHPPSTPVIGQPLAYTLTVSNAGPDTAGNVTVSDPLPASLTFVSATPSQGSCIQASGTVTCSLGSIANGANATITLVVTPTAAHPVTNTATVSSDAVDGNAANNIASDSVVIGTGTCTTPSFAGPFNFPAAVQDHPFGAATADFNKDGNLDIVAADPQSNQIAILLGNGAGGFQPAAFFATGSSPLFPAVGDFNQDGNPDVAVTIATGVAILQGNGGGQFGAPTTFAVNGGPIVIATLDFNNDSKLDLVVVSSTNVQTFTGNGTGTFTAAATIAIANGTELTIADVNGDRIQDLLVPTSTGTVGTLAISLGTGSGFGAPSTIALGTHPASVAVGDFDGNGKVDLAVANQVPADSRVTLLFGDGTGAFPQQADIAVSGAPTEVVAVDTNEDGKMDLVTANVAEGFKNVSILLGDGLGGFGLPITYQADGSPNLLITGDFNGDGKPDLAIANNRSRNISLLLNNCGGATIANLSTTLASSSNTINAGDTVTYTIGVTNHGSDPATNLILTDVLPTGATVTGSNTPGWACTVVNTVTSCTRPTLAVNAGSTLTFDVRLTAVGSRINNVSVFAAESDADSTNNSAAATVTVNAAPVTFTVTNTNNSGAGSLRQAITDANANAGSTNHIDFNIPGPAPFTIAPLSALPTITVPVVLDGTTQQAFMGTPCTPGAACAPVVELSGVNAPNAVGLRITSGNSTVRGLVVNRWTAANGGIQLDTLGGNTIAGNYIGTNVTGTSAAANARGVSVTVNSPNNVIGGTAPAERNVISGNTAFGVIVLGSPSNSGTIVQGNYIGTNAAGTAAVGNGGHGVDILAPNATIGGLTAAARNVISGNLGNGVNVSVGVSGITVVGSGSGTVIQDNYIGTNAAGTAAIGNSGAGVGVFTSSVTVGGAGVGNVISGNASGITASVATVDGVPVAAGSSLVVQGNNIGTNATGTSAIPNGTGISATGLSPTGGTLTNIRIGGTDANTGNLISGNTTAGISLNFKTTNALIQGNFIGTNATGGVGLQNTGDGIDISGSGNTVGPGNVISGNAGTGVVLTGSSATGNQVIGNLIGTDKTGTTAVPNLLLQSGINVTNGASSNVIGAPGAGNVVSGNARHAITVCCSNATSGNIIQGNLVGTNITGTAALGNGGIGIDVVSAANTTIGGAGAARNVVSANANWGIQIRTGALNTVVQGNVIGSDITGAVLMGNGFYGIHVQDTSGHTIGGTAAGTGNVIRGNAGGIEVLGPSAGNAIRGNNIDSNASIGIDLNQDGVTANDANDGDSGPNNLQNFPVVTRAVIGGGTITIDGTLNSAANTIFGVDFFVNASCDASGFGEGQTYLGSASVTTNGLGNTAFTAGFAFPVGVGSVITATATDSAGNTSEFGQCFTAGTVNTTANLSISKIHTTPAPTFAQPLSWTLTVSNAGPDAASNVLLKDPLPGGLTFVSATPTQGSCGVAGGILTCSLASLANAATWTVTVTVTPTAAQPLTNTAYVSSGAADPNAANNTASDSFVVGQFGPCAVPTFYLNIPDDNPGAATSLATGDFNHDGRLDVAVSDSTFGIVRVFLADVANPGSFNHTDYPVGSGNAGGLVVRDFDGDGNLDMAVAATAGANNIAFFKGSASGAFAAAVTTAVSVGPASPEAADLNGDGHPDLIVGYNNATSISVLLWNPATGAFANPVSYPSGTLSGVNIIVEDFDGNGTLDIATPNVGVNSFTILSGNGNGTFSAPTTMALPFPIVRLRKVGDLNGDGKPDLGATLSVTGSQNRQNLALLYNTGGAFSFGVPVEILPDSFGVGFFALGDVTGDGKVDLVTISNQSGLASVLVLPGDGAGNFGPPAQFQNGQQNVFEIVDVDGDGKPDVIGTGPVSDSFYVLQNTCGTPTNSDVSLTMTGPSTAPAGSTVTYTLTVTNNGPDVANGVVVLDYFGSDTFVRPAGSPDEFFSPTSSPPNAFVCGNQDGNFACWLAAGFDQQSGPLFTPLAPGASASFDVNLEVFSGAHTNRATVTSFEADPNNVNSNASVTTTPPAAALTFTVTNTNNSGAGSLRQAILESNANVGPPGSPNTISFNIPGPGPFTIAPAFPLAALPNINVPVVIDGTTQQAFMGTPCTPVAACPPIVELSGVNAPGNTGLNITAGGSTVRGLVINRWNTGINLGTSTTGGNTIVGNYIGTTVAGTAAASPTQFRGIQVNSPNTIIGGTTPADRNVISGNGSGSGILVGTQFNTTTGVVTTSGYGTIVQGNYIGLTANGSAAIGSVGTGVTVAAGRLGSVLQGRVIVGGTAPGAGNVIGGNQTNVSVVAQTTTGTTTIVGDGAGAVIQGNYIGTTAGGTVQATSLASTGIFIQAPNVTVGCDDRVTSQSDPRWCAPAGAARNVIAGNAQAGSALGGIFVGAQTLNTTTVVQTGHDVVIMGNYVGLKADGSAALANSTAGISVDAPFGLVGGTTAAGRNVVAGNTTDQIRVGVTSANSGANYLADGGGTIVQGNYIGTDPNGTVALGSGGNGISVTAPNVTIGGAAAGAGNLISGVATGVSASATTVGGVTISGSSMLVQGNYIGTNAAGTAAIANSSTGVQANAANVTVGGAGAPPATLGTTAGAGNLISGNAQRGIGASAVISNNLVISVGTGLTAQGNYIGTNAAGTGAIANGTGLDVQASGAHIGGQTAATRNVISGNSGTGVALGATVNSGAVVSAASNAIVEGNYIGTRADGAAALGNVTNGINVTVPSVTVGGPTAASRNVISGNGGTGIGGNVVLNGNTVLAIPSGLVVQGNYVGTDAAGLIAIPNGSNGMTVVGPNSIIGCKQGDPQFGCVAGARNVVSGNGNFGISIAPQTISGTTTVATDGAGSVVQGNYVGVKADGSAPLGNSSIGVAIGVPNVTVGGTTGAGRNVISGNGASGVNVGVASVTINNVTTDVRSGSGSVVQGNYIGTNPAGSSAMPNGFGVQVGGPNVVTSISNVTVGGSVAGAGNVISGNVSDGVTVRGPGATNNSIRGNFIGTDATGMQAVPNGTGSGLNGVTVSDGASSTTIGGTTAAERNVISGNAGIGVALKGGNGNSFLTTITGNYIGTDVNGTGAVPNTLDGVWVASVSSNTIGGFAAGTGNRIAFNGMKGVNVSGGLSNAIRGNAIFANAALGIDLSPGGVTANDAGDIDNGANNLQNFPVLTTATSTGGTVTVNGSLNSTATTTFALDFFASPSCNAAAPNDFGEGQTFLGTAQITTNGSGDVSFTKAFPFPNGAGNIITATATDPAGNTSEFSACITQNSLPTTTADSVTMTSDTSFTFNPAANDGDADVPPPSLLQTVNALAPGTPNLVAPTDAVVVQSVGRGYFGSVTGIGIFNPSTNAITGSIPLNSSNNLVLSVANQTTGYVYFRYAGSLVVVNSATNTIVQSLVLGSNIASMVLDDTRNRLYAATTSFTSGGSLTQSRIVVIDANPLSATFNQVINQTGLAGTGLISRIAVNRVTNKIYAVLSSGTNAGVNVIDGTTLSQTPIANTLASTALAVNEATNRVYVTTSIVAPTPKMFCINGSTDTVETSITMPAPLNPVVAINSSNNRVYARTSEFPASSRLVVVDGDPNNVATFNTIVAQPTVGREFFTSTLAVDAGADRVITSAGIDRFTSVFNATTGTFIASIPVSNGINSITIDPVAHRAYVAGNFGFMQVVDLTSATAQANIQTGIEVDYLVVDSTTHTAYVPRTGFTTDVQMVDSTGPAGILGANSPGNYLGRARNSVTNRIYVGNLGAAAVGSGDGLPGYVTVIDGATRSVLANVAAGNHPGAGAYAIAVDEAQNKIYIGNQALGGSLAFPGGITVMNGATHSTSAADLSALPSSGSALSVGRIAVNAATGRVYFVISAGSTAKLGVLNGTTNVGTAHPLSFAAGENINLLTVDPTLNRVYVVTQTGATAKIRVIDGSTDQEVTPALTIGVGGPLVGSGRNHVAVNTTTGKIYALDYNLGTLTAFDGSTFASTTIAVGRGPTSLGVNQPFNRIYVANALDKTLMIVNGSTLAVESTLPLPLMPVDVGVDDSLSRVFIVGGCISADIACVSYEAGVMVVDDPGNASGVLTVTAVTQGAHGTVVLNAGGSITYTPAAGFSGSDSFTYTVSDGHGGTANGTVNVTIKAPVSITPTSLPGGQVGNAYSQTLTGTGGTAPYQWVMGAAMAAGSLPPGLTLHTSTGVIDGVPTQAGTFAFTVTVRDAASPPLTGSRSYGVVINP